MKPTAVYLGWGVLMFAITWFQHEIFHPFAIFLAFFLLLIFFGMAVFSILYPVWSWRRYKRFRVWSFCPFLITLAVVLGHLFIPFEDCKVQFEHYLYRESREEFIDSVRSGGFGEYGNVELPWGLKRLSTDGDAKIYRNTPDAVVVGFWVFRGMLSGSRLVVYSSLDEAPTADLLRSGSVRIIRELSPHWYYLRDD